MSQPQNNSQDSQKSGDFADSTEQQKAASQDKINYSHAFDDDLENGGNLNGAVAGAKNRRIGGEPPTGNNASGRGFTISGKNPGPGTATDRGYGNVGSTDFGEDVDAPGIGSGQANTNIDEEIGISKPGEARNLQDTRPKDWDIAEDQTLTGRNQDSGLYGSGESGAGASR